MVRNESRETCLLAILKRSKMGLSRNWLHIPSTSERTVEQGSILLFVLSKRTATFGALKFSRGLSGED